MKVVSKTQEESMYSTYETPTVHVVLIQSEGVLCGSVGTEHEDFTIGGEYDL